VNAIAEGQLALIDVPVIPVLTDRQQRIFDAIEHAGYDGLFTEELGALEHQRLGKHRADQTCAFCGMSGKSVARELANKGLIVQRRKPTRWTVAGKITKPTSDEMPPGMTNAIPY
jgi:hypothetical protein